VVCSLYDWQAFETIPALLGFETTQKTLESTFPLSKRPAGRSPLIVFLRRCMAVNCFVKDQCLTLHEVRILEQEP
jgi:hypothetical protein